MTYKTSITDIKDGKEIIRGHMLKDLIKEKSFVETIFLILKGEMPTENETRMLNAIFTAAIDHGPGTASGQVARITASAKNSMHVSLAAGILAMGERHGSAIEGASSFFQKEITNSKLQIQNLIKKLKEEKVRVPGYGHPFFDHDERSDLLFALAKELGIYGDHCTFAESFHTELNLVSSKKLALNIDGSMGAIISDMGFDWRMAKGFFIIARVPGLIAHIYEEQMNDVGIRRIPQEEVEYMGV
ncbi:MAG: citryl-CoA lyase [Candidatus Magasanikbacteria bacterium]